MSHSSTSNSDPASWKRIWREALCVLFVLLALELIVRIGPIHALLAARLDSYENLLWYDQRLPAYQNQLREDPNYTIWLLGSSPMMTAWKPAQIQDDLRQVGHDDLTVQNFGYTTLTNLQVMAQLLDRWMLQIDQPQYVVLGISQLNFTPNAIRRMRIEDSQLESILIYPDNLDDYANQFLYRNSVLYRYLILARNGFNIPIEKTLSVPLRQGGYYERDSVLACERVDTAAEALVAGGVREDSMQFNLRLLDQMLDMIEAHGLPVLVVSLPPSHCQLERNYGSTEGYRRRYLDPVAKHLQQRGTAFVELDTLFQDRIAPNEQDQYFEDGTHANKAGATLLSEWVSQAIDDWLKTDP